MNLCVSIAACHKVCACKVCAVQGWDLLRACPWGGERRESCSQRGRPSRSDIEDGGIGVFKKEMR